MSRSRQSSFATVAIMLLLVATMASPALAQDCFPGCPLDLHAPAEGGSLGGDTVINGQANGAGGPPDGSDGSDESSSASGQNGAAQPGASAVGQSGQSGRVIPPPAPPPPPARTTTRSSSTSTNRSSTSNAASSTPDPLLSPSPSPSPTPSPTPSESPTPTPSPSDLVAALDDADPAAGDGSLLPFFAMVIGAILLFVYVRSRRPRRGMHSVGGGRRGGSHSF
jgi:hypothetical protein